MPYIQESNVLRKTIRIRSEQWNGKTTFTTIDWATYRRHMVCGVAYYSYQSNIAKTRRILRHTSVVVFGREVFYGQGITTTLPGRSHASVYREFCSNMMNKELTIRPRVARPTSSDH